MRCEESAEWAERPLTELPGVGPKRAETFAAALGARTLGELVRVLPRRYQAPAQRVDIW